MMEANVGQLMEILVVNGIGVLMMIFLYCTRMSNRESKFLDDEVFDRMLLITAGGCLMEGLSFVVDGRIFPGCRMLNYLTNSLCFAGTVCVGFLWCVYTELRVHHCSAQAIRRAKLLCIPFLLDLALVLANCIHPGLLFEISPENVYSRRDPVAIVYVLLFFYFLYSICVVEHTRYQGFQIRFFSVYCFVVPCIVGTVIQGAFYGVSVGWTCVAIAFMFVQIQSQSEAVLLDPMSGLFNRRYIDIALAKVRKKQDRRLFGIFLDVNGFKRINDEFGHSMGDRAIYYLGQILSNAIPDNAVGIRYAGDEFIVLLTGVGEETVKQTMARIEANLERFNRTGLEPFRLSVAMGYSQFRETDQNGETFLAEMDARMYEAKRDFYAQHGNNRRTDRAGRESSPDVLRVEAEKESDH